MKNTHKKHDTSIPKLIVATVAIIIIFGAGGYLVGVALGGANQDTRTTPIENTEPSEESN